jgi:hypothetical protein
MLLDAGRARRPLRLFGVANIFPLPPFLPVKRLQVREEGAMEAERRGDRQIGTSNLLERCGVENQEI